MEKPTSEVPPAAPEQVEPPDWSQLWPPLSYWWRAATVVIGVVIAVRVLATLQNVLLIILAAFVISLGLQPMLSSLERRGMRRGAGMAVIVLAGLVVVAGLAAVIIPTVATQATTAVERLPDLVADLEQRSPVIADVLAGLPIPGNGEEVEGEQAIQLLGSVAVGVFNTVTLLLLVPHFAVNFPAIKRWMIRLLRRDHRQDFIFVVNQSIDLTSNYIVGNLTISVIAGVVSFAGFLLIGLPYAAALAAWVAVTDMIPGFGAMVGAVPVLIVAAVTGGDAFIWSLLLLIVYQQIENYILAPRVMKRAVDLSPPVVIAALLVGGTLAGIVGALLALPVAALAKVLIHEFLIRRRVETIRTGNLVSPPAARKVWGRIRSRPLP